VNTEFADCAGIALSSTSWPSANVAPTEYPLAVLAVASTDPGCTTSCRGHDASDASFQRMS
jgi:hypothetical protein